ncbi:MAG: class I SAM-dependent methyltransferase [Verrucomicrobiales bacterium]|nr:class I SAM-dependent methyltransferase [Verrucomicrobiales bacterium]
MPRIVLRHCPACYTDNTAAKRLPLGPKKWPLKTCGACGFTYLERAAPYVEMEETFAWEKTSQQETARRVAAEPTVSRVSDALKTFRARTLRRDKLTELTNRHVRGDGTVVDIGCAHGRFLKTLAGRFPLAGVEISRALAAKAAKNLPGATIIQADAVSGLGQLPPDSAAAVIMSAFLEHEIEPRLLLAATLRALRPGGVAIVKVPNFGSLNRRFRKKKWCGFRFPDHVNYFTPRTIVAMARTSGFEIREFRLRDHPPISDNLWIVLAKPTHPLPVTTTPQPCSQDLPPDP